VILFVASADTDQGLPETIERLFQALESPLLKYALRLTRDFNAAQDLVQEAFLRLHSQFEHIHIRRAWLYRTVHKLATHHQRKGHPVAPQDSPAGGPPAPGAEAAPAQPLPDEQTTGRERIGPARQCLNNLDERSRELLRLKFREGMSYQQISAHTGLTAGQVGCLLHHALKQTAEEFAKIGVIP
jgi:RNA polymerase sigma-70 factor (ECF subfamily)